MSSKNSINTSNSDDKSSSIAIDANEIPNNDLEILIKMEHANRELEANQKSAQSILSVKSSDSPLTLSRRASFASFEVNSMKDDETASRHDETSWELWNQIISDWTTWSKKKPVQLKEYIRKGIPLYLRPLAWQYLSSSNMTDLKEKFKDYLKKPSICEKIIRRDVDRTYPDQELFKNGNGQESLFNIMKAYSIYDPEVGYCQGSAFICGLLLLQNIPEEETFAIFVQIMQQYHLREVFKPNMYYLGLCMYQLECFVEDLLPDLHSHFITQSFHTSMYSSSWFLTLFTTSLTLPLVCRIMDIFLNEGLEIIFRMALALLEFHKDNLLLLDMEGLLKYFQKELLLKHENDHDTILNRAFQVKYNAKKMKKLEKDYMNVKKDEQEEQVELRRYKTENRLLKQRIENLEKESASLAERLIQGQVVNAQNGESIDQLKNSNKKLFDKIMEFEANSYENSIVSNNFNEKINEIQILNEKMKSLVEENNLLRETPHNQKLEEELVEVKLRDAEAQLAIKELQKTIHVLNLEYQEFLNRSANPKLNVTKNDLQILEEELLKVKMREAETVSEMKALNLKVMQMETEKQVAYNQIKRQVDEIKRLNVSLQEFVDKDLDTKNQLLEYRYQLDDKEAKLKELNMVHKLKELEDSHIIAELRQRVAALEVHIQELVTTDQINENNNRHNEGDKSSKSHIDNVTTFVITREKLDQLDYYSVDFNDDDDDNDDDLTLDNFDSSTNKPFLDFSQNLLKDSDKD